ncbi:MAG: DNA topology modulation protein [Alphaproteobacteria bacterium]|nr:DNA topology modulation protein [Alphaproteobacteria bacterium]
MALIIPSKIMIFGRPGGGKSTFARMLSKLTNIPVHHLDRHFYLPNWVERDYQEFLEIQQLIVETDRWIIDGNNTKSLETRYKNADLVLYFNYPKFTCYWRVLKRFLTKKENSEDRAFSSSENIIWIIKKNIWKLEEHLK